MKNAICALSGEPCRCESKKGCRARYRTPMDGPSDEMVQALRASYGNLFGVVFTLEDAVEPMSRCFPNPEVRTDLRTLKEIAERWRKYAAG